MAWVVAAGGPVGVVKVVAEPVVELRWLSGPLGAAASRADVGCGDGVGEGELIGVGEGGVDEAAAAGRGDCRDRGGAGEVDDGVAGGGVGGEESVGQPLREGAAVGSGGSAPDSKRDGRVPRYDIDAVVGRVRCGCWCHVRRGLHAEERMR